MQLWSPAGVSPRGRNRCHHNVHLNCQLQRHPRYRNCTSSIAPRRGGKNDRNREYGWIRERPNFSKPCARSLKHSCKLRPMRVSCSYLGGNPSLAHSVEPARCSCGTGLSACASRRSSIHLRITMRTNVLEPAPAHEPPSQACPGCGSSLPDSAKFCPECGRTAAVGSRRCSNCNAALSDHANFCSSCGFRVA